MEILRVAWTETDLFRFGERSGYVSHWDIDEPENEFEVTEWHTNGDPKYYKMTDEYQQWIRQRPRDGDELAEAAGRLCYKSFNRPNPATAKTDGYVANILKQQHYSVLEHASVTYYVTGVSRSLLTELERHRHLSFSVVSQRYVDHSDTGWVIPPAIEELPEIEKEELKKEIGAVVAGAQAAYGYIFGILTDNGFKKKQAREAARAVLPGATHTEFLVTGNLRVWRELLQKRLSPGADAEIRQLAELLLADLKDYAPATFQDFE